MVEKSGFEHISGHRETLVSGTGFDRIDGRGLRPFWALVGLFWLIFGAVGWAQSGPLAEGRVTIQGNRLTIFANDQTTDANQVLDVGEQAQVRTCFGGPTVPCGSVKPGDPRIVGLEVHAELRGPELPTAQTLTTVPGGTFLLPGFQQEGDYRLENIRMVSTADGQVVGFAEPSVAILQVRQIVLASATVRTLSLEELQARGITLTEENFQAFDFAVGFALEDEIVEIRFPVLYTGNGQVEPLGNPEVILDGLPSDAVSRVARWKPPRIIPFRLEAEGDPEGLDIGAEEEQELIFPVFGAIVIPGTITYLNQFFEAELMVANGAPGGSDVRLEKMRAVVKLPPDRSVRLAKTDPPVAPGQEVPIVGPGGLRSFAPGQQGSAAWTLEGLRPGTHVVSMDIFGDIVRPGRDPLPVLSRAQAAVEVVDARFNLTFSHPDVVSEGNKYTLYVTVTNQSQQVQNLVSVEIRDEHMTGAHPADPNDSMIRTIESLEPNQSVTVEYDLISELNGKVVATTFQSETINVLGTILLRTGVGELGIPLSPATLVMPRFTEYLQPPHMPDDELVRSHVRLYSLAYSLASAPTSKLPPGVPFVKIADVERRAIDLAEAGQRLYLQDQLLESLEVLALDQLGNRHPLAGFDELRRRTTKGLRSAVQIARFLRQEQGNRGLDANGLFDHFAETMSYTRPFMMAMLEPEVGSPAPDLQILDQDANGILAGLPEHEETALRTLPWGEIYGIQEAASGGDTVPLAIVGRMDDPDNLMQVLLVNSGTETARGHLTLMVPDGTTRSFRKLDLGLVTVPAGATVAVDVSSNRADGDFRPYDFASNAVVGSPALRSTVPLPPFRIIGARQDFRMDERGPDRMGNYYRPNRYGNGITYLFNRPPEEASAQNEESWRIFSSFEGETVLGEPTSGTTDKVGTGAWLQPNSERVVNVRYIGSISAFLNPADGLPLSQHEHRLDLAAIEDTFGNSLSQMPGPPILETTPLHVGGLLEGKVIRGTGEPVANAKVQLIRPREFETPKETKIKLDLTATYYTDETGRFFFDYIEHPNWDHQVTRNFVVRATVPEGDDPLLEPADVEEVTSIIRQQHKVAKFNIALLGRGSIRGKVVYLDTQQPVPRARVLGASTLFNEVKSANVDDEGHFELGGLPVGPITLTASDKDGRKVYATVGIDRPGEIEEVVLEIQRNVASEETGTVKGRVLRISNGETVPAIDATVAVYSNGNIISQKTIVDPEGRFEVTKVPVGKVSVQAADFRVSRSATFTDAILEPNQTVEVDLKIADADTHVITGTVQFRDPITNSLIPIEGAVAFIEGPGNFAYTDATGRYRIEGVPSQGVSDSNYFVHVIDYARQQEAEVPLPPILDASPEVIEAQPVILESMRGSVRGVALDPLGRPVPGAEVVLYPFAEGVAGPDGSFEFENVPLGSYQVVIHVGDGLQPGKVGWIGRRGTKVIYGGHSPFVTVQMRGGGGLRVKTRTATATGILTPIYYRPTYYSDSAKNILLRGQYIETSTDPLGDLELSLPVGPFNLVAYNPFHGVREIDGEIEYPGQIVDLDILFEDSGKVRGMVVAPDGVTPVPDVEVYLETKAFEPQRQFAGPDGTFQFELVPKGPVVVTANGFVGTVQRVGRTQTYLTTSGQEIDIIVQMKEQGSVTGVIKEKVNDTTTALSYAQYYIKENSYPFRRLPQAEGTYFTADAQGRYEVSHIYAGRVTVHARDPFQVQRKASVSSTITADWQVREMPDIVMKTSIGDIEVLIRDPATGGPVADAQVRLSTGEWTISGPDGRALWEAVPLGTYSVYAFYAPTGQSGRVGNLRLTAPAQLLKSTIYLDQRGTIGGTLWEDALKIMPVPGGTIRLSGNTAGGRVVALATTSGQPGIEGTFSFEGIPEGEFSLTAGVQGTPRRARATASITDTNPEALIDMILEPIDDLHFLLYEKLSTGSSEINTSLGIFSLRLTQPTDPPDPFNIAKSYDFTRLDKDPATGTFYFPDVLMNRGLSINAQEVTDEQRSRYAGASRASNVNLPGSGTEADPYQLQLRAKAVVRVTVRDGSGALAPQVNVRMSSSGGQFPGVTNSDGQVVFYAVPVGGVTATATNVLTGLGGKASGTLVYDDDVLELQVQLASAVSAQGVIYQPIPDDVDVTDPSQLVPMNGAIVSFKDASGSTQVMVTGEDGRYRFDALRVGGYTIEAQDNNGDQFAKSGGSLSGPDGFLNSIPPLILDASPPRILSITPPTGSEGVSRRALVEIIFSERLHGSVLPSGNNPSYFKLRSANGSLPAGSWTHSVDAGRQIVRFTPSANYENRTTYSLTILGSVIDRQGRRLTDFGNVGTNFKTSDSVGPGVLGTVPSFDSPVDPAASIRVDFTEAVTATHEQLDGDGVGDAATLLALKNDGTWVELPVVLFLTRQNYSLQVEPLQGFVIDGDTLRRKLVVSGLLDVFDNPMPVWEGEFRIFDENPPVLDAVPFPAEANGTADLIAGVRYTLVPQLSNLDELTPENPGGDIDRVDYFVFDPDDPTNPSQPAFSARSHPFAYAFFGAYTGNGVDPRPFPIWVRAVDTSTNESELVKVEMQVLPNTPPTVGLVTADALSPIAGTFYAGSNIRAFVSEIDDPDANRLTVAAQLKRHGTDEVIQTRSGRTINRPAGGWQDLAPQAFDFTIPLSEPEASNLYVRAWVIDTFGALAEVESDRFAVADDTVGPQIDDLQLRRDDNTSQLQFFIGERFRVQFRARDLETAIDPTRVEVLFDRDDIFPASVTASRVSGDLYRTDFLDVPPDLFFESTPVNLTVRTFDQGDNENTRDLLFSVAPEPDPTAPIAEWLTPWSGGEWPAEYTSVLPQDGSDFLLRARVTDLALDENDNEVPGTIVEVRFRGPVLTENGTIELAETWQLGELVSGTGGPGTGIYQLLWQVPNAVPAGTSMQFAVRAVDSGGKVTQQIVQVEAVLPRRVFEGVLTTVSRDNTLYIPGEGDENGPVFLLDGSTVSLQPQTDGTVRTLPAVYIYTGGEFDGGGNLVPKSSILTAPEINTYDSAITHHNLELEVERVLGIGHGSRVDMDSRGLLGKRGDGRVILLPGQTGPGRYAGGSHGGLGWLGSPNSGWNQSDLRQPGETYDSLRDPQLPGGGGGTSGSSSRAGGTGGGVIRLFAEDAVVHLAGVIRARGMDPTADNDFATEGGGGAGGAIRLVAGRLEGAGVIDASGGSGSDAFRAGGGGGGRISISYHELDAALDLDTQVKAFGGATRASNPQRYAGAGTIFIEQLDDLGLPVDGGRLLLRNASGKPSNFTPLPALGDGLLVGADAVAGTVTLDRAKLQDILVGDLLVLEWDGGLASALLPIMGQQRVSDATAPQGTYVRLFVDADPVVLGDLEAQIALDQPVSYYGRGRLGSIDAAGAVRMLTHDELEMGPDASTSIDDRTYVTHDTEARVALRSDTPSAVFTADPDGGDVRLGTTLNLSWTVSDPIGLTEVRERWSLATEDTVRTFTDAPIEATSGTDPIELFVPFDTAPGELTYTVTGTDVAGRTAVSVQSWNVLENADPVGSLALGSGQASELRAGYDVTIEAHAEDLEGLAQIDLLTTGPAEPAAQSVAITGLAVDQTFVFRVPAAADGSAPVVVQLQVTDATGAVIVSEPLTLTVIPNDLPTATATLADGAPAIVKPENGTQVRVQAADVDGLSSIELRVSGPMEPATQTVSVEGDTADVTFDLTVPKDAVAGPVSVTAVATDIFGAAFESEVLELEVIPNALPTGTLVFADGTPTEILPGSDFEVVLDAADEEGLAEVVLSVTGPAGPTPIVRLVSGLSASETFQLSVPQTAMPDEVIEVTAEVTDAFGNPATVLGPISLGIAGDATPPTVSFEGVAAQYRSGDTLGAMITATDAVGVARVDVSFDGSSTTFTDPGPSYDYIVEVDRTITTARTVTFSVTATDFADNTSDPISVDVELIPDLVPVLSLTQLPGAAVLPGSLIEVIADASDDVTLERLDFAMTGAVVDNEVRVLGTQTANETFRRTLPTTLQGGDQVTVTVSALDNFGHTTVEAVTYTVSGDIQLPVPNIDLDPENPTDTYFSGEAITVTATASDNVEVSSISLTVDGEVTSGSSLVIYNWTAPAVAETTVFDLVVEATDTAGNVGTETRSVTIEPLENAGRPEVSFDCLSSGATLPSGDALTLTVTATDDLGVSMVEIFRDDEVTPFAVLTPATGTELTFTDSALVTLPLAMGGEAVVRYRAVAHDASLNTGETEITLHTVETVELLTSGNDWSALETQIGVLRSGTLNIDQPRTLGGLIVLGGQISHSSTSPSAEKRLELDVQGPVYIGCAGELDTSARGYGPNTTYPNEARPGSRGGGSHIGIGGEVEGSTYGSIYRPLEAGGGGEGSNDGKRGGGVIRVSAQQRFVIDGSVLANGHGNTNNWARGGAGGSVWLSVDGLLAGAGRIQTHGGSSGPYEYGSGGGGAIALDYVSSAGALLDRVTAFGGSRNDEGGAGSIVLRRPESVYGDVILNNGTINGDWTYLPELGAGEALAGSGASTLVVVPDQASGVQPFFVGHYVEIYDGTSLELEGVFRIAEINFDQLLLESVDGLTVPAVDEGDLWQGAYYFDNMELKGRIPIVQTDAIRVTGNIDVGESASILVEDLTAGSLRMREGSRMTQWLSDGLRRGTGLTLDLSGDLVIEAGATIDVSARGYGRGGKTYPGETSPGGRGGGSHIGRGGSAAGSAYGSIYRPREMGGGGEGSNDGGYGGGVLRITAQNVLLLDSTATIRADGEGSRNNWTRGGAGGSVWITVQGSILGSGIISANGGPSGPYEYGSGGGGALALEFGTSLDPTIEANLRSRGGWRNQEGGAGSIYLFGPASVFGDLILDNGTIRGGATTLPYLGSGTAQAGSAGALLMSGRTATPAYFEGHWIEVRDGSGSLKGTWRVASIGADGSALVLEALSGPAPSVDPGDTWQGVYRFDNYSVLGDVPVNSPDPIRVGGTQEIVGSVQVREIEAGNLVLRSGAVLTHPYSNDPANPEGLSIKLTGSLIIEDGASIDVSGRGFAANRTYPGETAPGGRSGGSHIGRGGLDGGSAASTYGSVYRPQENGGGGENSSDGRRGGGVVRIEAREVVVDGSILANGIGNSNNWTRGGAGGSVWVTVTDTFSGSGVVAARGGSSGPYEYGSGGGGAIAIEHNGASGLVMDNLRAWGGTRNEHGGAGSVYLRGPASTYGDLIVDNSTNPLTPTILPPLGGGQAQAGSDGSTLVTDLLSIQPYFVGHWVEVTNGVTGAVEGRWRVASISGSTLTLEPNGFEAVTVDVGDGWQGVYLFDNYKTVGSINVISEDPIRVTDTQELEGTLQTRRITGNHLVLRSGAVLTHPYTSSAADPETLEIDLSGDLILESGATIDVSGRGYRYNQAYPGAVLPGGRGGGSHIGRGGHTPGSTYGSIYRPRESGGGGEGSADGRRGGGIVKINARHVELQAADSSIKANGAGDSRNWTRGGAGGSIWVQALGQVRGQGFLSAKGGVSGNYEYGSGGGGAIAVEYQGTTGTILQNLRAYGGSNNQEGGAGSVYLLGPSAEYGDLLIDNTTIVGHWTDLPSFGAGVAQSGSLGDMLVVDRTGGVPAYFVGHWVEIYTSAGVHRGTWRIAAVDGSIVTLEANVQDGAPGVQPGDQWQGVYLLDNLTLRGNSQTFYSEDPVLVTGTQTIDGAARLRRVQAGDLELTAGSLLRHPNQVGSARAEILDINVERNTVIGAGARIDVTGLGYGPNQTYPGAVAPGNRGGGSHIGRGGSVAGTTYGSVYRPQEHGGGGENSSDGRVGGGTVRLTTGNDLIFIDAASSILADGLGAKSNWTRGGAGGSIWLDVGGAVRGDGFLRADGGSSGPYQYGSAGGGAIAVYHQGVVGTTLDNSAARGGRNPQQGGTGSLFFHGPTSSYGDLILDAGTVTSGWTELPAMGGGVAQNGSSGDLLVTDAVSIPAYFVGHWVEIYDGVTGDLESVRQVVEISGAQVRLAGTSPSVDAGDRWQGAYYFDNLTTHGRVPYRSADPIRVAGDMVVEAGDIYTDRIEAHNLTVKDGGILRHTYTTSNTDPKSLTLELSGDFDLQVGGQIDLFARGYRSQTTYPGETLPGVRGGGSHLGRGGDSPGSTYGSVYRPFENGAGGENTSDGDWGGGVIKITAQNVNLDGDINVHGQGNTSNWTRGGAGGSVWIEARDTLSGEGTIRAQGGSSGPYEYGSGGGGAVALYFDTVTGSLLDNVIARGGNRHRRGGAGTIYTFDQGTSIFGDLLVDNRGESGQATELPAFGTGAAQPGTVGDTLVTDRTVAIPAYFIGHWVEISNGGSTVGRWRIASLDGVSFTLEPNGSEIISLQPGYTYSGLYRFDNVTVTGNAWLVSADPVEDDGVPLVLATGSTSPNTGAPEWRAEAVSVEVGQVPGSYRIALTGDAAADADGISEIRLSDGEHRLTGRWTDAGLTFRWPGRPGDGLTLTAFDGHGELVLGQALRLPPLPGLSGISTTEPDAETRRHADAGATKGETAIPSSWLAELEDDESSLLRVEGAWLTLRTEADGKTRDLCLREIDEPSGDEPALSPSARCLPWWHPHVEAFGSEAGDVVLYGAHRRFEDGPARDRDESVVDVPSSDVLVWMPVAGEPVVWPLEAGDRVLDYGPHGLLMTDGQELLLLTLGDDGLGVEHHLPFDSIILAASSTESGLAVLTEDAAWTFRMTERGPQPIEEIRGHAYDRVGLAGELRLWSAATERSVTLGSDVIDRGVDPERLGDVSTSNGFSPAQSER